MNAGEELQEVPVGRWLVIVTGVACVMTPWSSRPVLSFVTSAVFLVLIGLVLRTLASNRRSHVSTRIFPVLMAICASVGVIVTLGITLAAHVPLLAAAPLTAVVWVSGLRLILSPLRPPISLLALLVTCQVWLIALGISRWSGNIDVALFLSGGLDALADGQSPYAITIENPYSPEDTEQFYGPGVVSGGRVQYGFPYLPAPLILDLPAHLVSNAVWMHLGVLVAAIVGAWHLASDHLGRAAIVTFALGPSSAWLILNHWVEPLLIGLLTLVMWGLSRNRRWAVAVGLGLLFSSKQYAVFFLPAVWPVLRCAGWRPVAIASLIGSSVVLSFVVMDPHAFYRSVVELQFLQPFREDATSLLPGVQALIGDVPGVLLGILPFVGVLVSAFVAHRTMPGPTSFAMCVGLGLLASVMFSKVGFINYFMFIGAALLWAGVTWPSDDPIQMRDPSSQGSRGERGISRTR